MIPFEDTFLDILKKACIGKGMSKRELAKLSHLNRHTLNELFDGQNTEPTVIEKVCPYLDLNPQALNDHLYQKNVPNVIVINGFKTFQSSFFYTETDILKVNNYLLYDKNEGEAVLFDTGTEYKVVQKWLKTQNLKLKAIFITHNHRDHVYCLKDFVQEQANLPIYCSNKADIKSNHTVFVEPKETISIGNFNIRPLETPGHTPDGITYQINGLDKTIAVVGDALFAHSQGGIMHPEVYAKAIEINRNHILSLDQKTIIAPGHGPLTTVEHEQKYNPFYANFFTQT
tara:strand:- start:1677 stop:2534 length:858 start_codon:yes stop_codon:yes gene_type:complete